jgi:N-acyl-D-aspartate/D-glutamate deacylase
LTLFDPATARNEATFEDPHRYPTGIPYVIVNGAVAVDDGRFNPPPRRPRAGPCVTDAIAPQARLRSIRDKQFKIHKKAASIDHERLSCWRP